MIANPELRFANTCRAGVLFATIAVVLAASLSAEVSALQGQERPALG